MPVAISAQAGEIDHLRISPLQMSLAAGTLSNHGIRISSRIVLAVNTSQQGWVILPAIGQSVQVFNSTVSDHLAESIGNPKPTVLEMGRPWKFQR